MHNDIFNSLKSWNEKSCAEHGNLLTKMNVNDLRFLQKKKRKNTNVPNLT